MRYGTRTFFMAKQTLHSMSYTPSLWTSDNNDTITHTTSTCNYWPCMHVRKKTLEISGHTCITLDLSHTHPLSHVHFPKTESSMACAHRAIIKENVWHLQVRHSKATHNQTHTHTHTHTHPHTPCLYVTLDCKKSQQSTATRNLSTMYLSVLWEPVRN